MIKMKFKTVHLFGFSIEITDSGDEILDWSHEFTEMFLISKMDIDFKISLPKIRDYLESKMCLAEIEFQGALEVQHIISPHGYNCLMGREH